MCCEKCTRKLSAPRASLIVKRRVNYQRRETSARIYHFPLPPAIIVVIVIRCIIIAPHLHPRALRSREYAEYIARNPASESSSRLESGARRTINVITVGHNYCSIATGILAGQTAALFLLGISVPGTIGPDSV